MKKYCQKPLKKLTLFFLSNSVPFDGQSYEKQKGPGVSDQLLLRLQVHKNFFISYIISDQVWYCTIKRFLSYSKNYTCKFMQANSWHHKLFHFHLFFWIWKVWKGRGKIIKIWISREQKKLFRWNKSNKKHFSQFSKGCHLVKKYKFDKK